MPAAEPAGIPSVFCSCWAGRHSPAQSRVSRCLVQREASQTWRASELSPVAQLGQLSAAGGAVTPKRVCVKERLELALPSALSKLPISSWCYSSLADPLCLRELEPVAQVKISGGTRALGAAAQPRRSCQNRNTSRVIQRCLCPLLEQGAAVPGAVYQAAGSGH